MIRHLWLLALLLAPAPRQDAWKVLGPGGGGAMFLPTISPHDPNQVVLRCDMTGGYITHDGGLSWRMYNLRGTIQFFAFDPASARTIYAASGGGLYRSTDSGATWELVFPAPAAIARIERIDDHAGERIITRQGRSRSVAALAVDPGDSKLLYAAVREGGAVTLETSRDWGRTWKKEADLAWGARRIYIDPRSPRKRRTVYIVGDNSVAVRKGGAWTWGPAPAGVFSFTDISAGLSPAGLVVYAVAPSGLFVWAGGESWRQASLGAPAAFTSVATSLHHPEVAYVSYNKLEGKFFGVARTGDGGLSWTPVWKESNSRAENIHDAWISERFGPGWGSNPIHLGVGPHDPNLCYGTDYGRVMRTTDGGKNWNAVYSSKSEGGWTTTGLDVTTCYGVHFDPFDARRIFISYTDIGLFRSEDGGSSWVSSTAGVPRPWVNTTYWVEFDPEVKGRVWAVASGVHDLPRPKMWRRRQPSTYNGGVIASDDGGRTWSVAGAGLPPTAATHILLDPASPTSARVLYVAGFGRGVFKSSDGGRSWALKNEGIEGSEPFAWRLARDREGALYLVVARRSEDGSIGNARDGALYRSTDGAEHWTKLVLPGGVNGPNGLAIDPRDPRRLYLAAWRRAVREGPGGGGVFLSTDRGASWQNVLDRDQHVYDVAIDPRAPDVLYACGFSSSAWRSEDRGQTWRRLRGYNFKWGHRVTPDPRDEHSVYVTTFGGSLWHGLAAGDPKATEDIVTPVVAHEASGRIP